MQKERIANELIRSFIIAAHGNLEQVQELLAEEPGLLYASYNWGGDDWESGLGAAAMLGQFEIVKSILQVQPEAAHTPGPHCIPLLQHARMGGEDAQHVYDYLLHILQPT